MHKSAKILRFSMIVAIILSLLTSLGGEDFNTISSLIVAIMILYALHLVRGENELLNRAFIFHFLVVIIPPILGLIFASNLTIMGQVESLDSFTWVDIGFIILTIIIELVAIFKEKYIYYGIIRYNHDKNYNSTMVDKMGKNLWKLTWLFYVIAVGGLIVLVVSIVLTEGASDFVIALLPAFLIFILVFSVFLFIRRYRFYRTCEEVFKEPPANEFNIS